MQSTTTTSVQLLFPKAHIWRPDSIIPFVFWQRNSSEVKEEREEIVGRGWGGSEAAWSKPSLLIMCSLPCLTSLTPSLPHANQMSSTADDKLHPNSRSIEFQRLQGSERSTFRVLKTIISATESLWLKSVMDSQAGGSSVYFFKSKTTVNQNYSVAGDFYVSRKCESDYVQVALPTSLHKIGSSWVLWSDKSS